MKKFFKNLAFASLAIAGILVSSCKIEDINTTFQPKNAEATITVTALDALNANLNITNDPELKLSASSTANVVIEQSGNVFSIKGAPALPEQTVTISADYKGETASSTVKINSLLAGGIADYTSTVVVGTPDPTPAYAFIAVTVWDNEDGVDVTEKANLDIEYDGDFQAAISKGTITIEGENGIPAMPAKITAIYYKGERTLKGEATLNIDKIEKWDYKNYAVTIALGVAPVTEPAEVSITVLVYDFLTETFVTEDAEVLASSSLTGSLTPTGNVFTITGTEEAPAIPAQQIYIGAKYNGKYAAEETLNLGELPPGATLPYEITVPVDSPAIYPLQQAGEPTSTKVVGTFFSPNGHQTYTHDYKHATTGHGEGEGQWLYNETEFILVADTEYKSEYGVVESVPEYTDAATEIEKAIVDSYAELLDNPVAKTETKKLPMKISAFAMYSAYGTKIYTTTVYNVIRHITGKEDVVVGTITVKEVATQAEYCEAAMPGHSGHYHYGHGHDDVHGYSSNAGGGIIFAE
ncbi:MAG: DUF3869 domain-containing protein [Bacteroidales bacterium]|nr:DUF3869 domain-containing protein [Bacteroidales bacterium]